MGDCMGFIMNSEGRWVGAGVVGDFRRDDKWYFDSVEEEIPDYLEDGEFETPEEYGEAVQIHATYGNPEEVFDVDWVEVGQALVDQGYSYEAEDAANIGKDISSTVASQHGDQLTDIRNGEPSVVDGLLDQIYEFAGSSRDKDYKLEDFEQQSEEA